MKRGMKIRHFAVLLCLLNLGILFPAFAKDNKSLFLVSFQVTRKTAEARKMLKEINTFRTNGSWYWNPDDSSKTVISPGTLGELRIDPVLEETAMKRAEEIAVYYSHTRPNGTSCFTAFPKGGSQGENLVYLRKTPVDAFLAWKEDERSYSGQGHRRNMLNPEYKYIGIGCVEKDGVKYWTQAFSSKGSGAALQKPSDISKVAKVSVKADLVEEEGILLLRESEDPRSASEVFETELEIEEHRPLPKVVPYIKIDGRKLFGSASRPAPDISDPSAISVTDGKFTALKPGNTKIRFTTKSFSGTVISKDFLIKIKKIKLRLSHGEIDAKRPSEPYSYTGHPIAPDPILIRREKRLKKGKDYLLEYENNLSAGTAHILVTGIGNYTGSLSLPFEISPADASDFPVSGLRNMSYTGHMIEQEFEIKDPQGKVLTENTDYLVSYRNNLLPGTAVIEITYIGNYKGKTFLSFSIEPKKETVPEGTSDPVEAFDPGRSLTPPKDPDHAFYRLFMKTSKKNKEKIRLIIETSKGYITKLQYSLNKKMKKAKTVKIRKNRTVIRGLKFGRAYYVRLGHSENGTFRWGKVRRLKES